MEKSISGACHVKLIADLDPDQHRSLLGSPLWEKVCARYFWLPLSVEYYAEYHQRAAKDLSMVVLQDGKPVTLAVCHSMNGVLSYFHFPFTVHTIHETIEQQDAPMKAIIGKIEELKNKGLITGMKCYFNPHVVAKYFGKITSISREHYGVIDLSLPREMIKANMRRDFKPAINWGEKNFRMHTMDKANADKALFDSFKQFHIKVSGRQTRSDRTWDIQFKMIQEGQGYLTLAYYNDGLASADLVLCGKEEAFYAVAVNDRELMQQDIPVAHYPIFHSILYAKQAGYRTFNTEFVDYHDDPKRNNISKFKRGFTNAVDIQTYYDITF